MFPAMAIILGLVSAGGFELVSPAEKNGIPIRVTDWVFFVAFALFAAAFWLAETATASAF